MIKTSRIITSVVIIALCNVCSFVWADNDLINRIQEAEKSIVTVQTELNRTTGTNPSRKVTYYRTAAGIVIDPIGIIVTNTHTIIHAPFIFVILRDGTKLHAEVIFVSQKYDFSFLRIHPPHLLRRITWADSSLIKVGDNVVAIGHSENDNQSILSGHIKSILQSHSNASHEFLELDLTLYHGDSGGPILDEQGRLLGIVMAKSKTQEHSSLAIAANKIHHQYLHYKKNVP